MATKKTDKTPAKAAPAAEAPIKKAVTKAPATRSIGKAKVAAPPKAAVKKAPVKKGPKPAPKAQGPRHPKGRVTAAHGSKEALAKSIAGALVRGDEDAAAVEDRLRTASNSQLLRLASAVETVKKKWGSRDKLIAAIGAAEKKSKDQDYLNKLGSMGLPQLVDLATSAERRA